jgi:hypothetical protein
MKSSPSIELVWQLAAREDVMTSFKEIGPEHLLGALLKFSEVNDDELRSVAVGLEVLTSLTAQREHVRTTFAGHGVASTTVRHRLREKLGNGGGTNTSGEIHRSVLARDVFDDAVKSARESGHDALDVEHVLRSLLKRPTPTIAEVLGPYEMLAPHSASAVLGLLKYTRDLTDLVMHHGSGGSGARPDLQATARGTAAQAIATAVIDVLAREARRCLILVVSDVELLASVILNTAERLMTPAVAPPELRGRRVKEIVVTRLFERIGNPREVAERLTALVANADAVTETGSWGSPILYLCDVANRLTTDPTISIPLLAAIQASQTPCICAVSPSGYERYLLTNRAVSRSHVMWLRSGLEADLPRQL